MATKEAILNKRQILITNHFESSEKAFSFFDKRSSDKLTKSDIKHRLKSRNKPIFKRDSIIKINSRYYNDADKLIDWEEFKSVIDEITQ